MYAVYISLILLSVQAFIAEESVDKIRENMDDSYDYYLIFREDGVTTHYDVKLRDTSEPGRIWLTYYTDSNRLEISKVENIQTLKIDVNSMFEDESERVFKQVSSAAPTMDMDYWLEANGGIFTIEFNIAEGDELESLSFNEFPEPVSVTVNNVEWWKTNTNFDVGDGEITISDIPTGETTVVIDFNEDITNQIPVPSFTITPDGTVGVNEEVSFDASASYDPDGSIASFLWKFGDTEEGSGETTTHTYTAPGTYTVRLTVRDDFEPFAEAFIEKDITVQFGADDDTDSDGLKDYWEWEHFGNLDQTATGDADSDNYNNMLEFLAKTDPSDSSSKEVDSDNDTLEDLKEWDYFQSLQYNADEDPDSDTFTNKEEFDAGTDPSDFLSYPDAGDEPGDGDDEGMFGLGKMGGIDTFLILMIVIIVVVIAIFAVIATRSRKAKERKDAEMAAQQRAQVPVRGPPPAAAPEAAPPTQLEAMPPEPPAPPQPMAPEPMPDVPDYGAAPEPVPAPMPEVPAEEPVVEDIPVEDIPVEDVAVEDVAVEDVPVEDVPVEDVAVEDVAVEDVPVEDVAVEEAAVDEVDAADAALPAEPARDEVVNSYITELDIGQFEAGVLYDSGYTSYEALEGAIVEEIAMIDEIGEDMAEKIMNNLQVVLAGGAAAAAVAEGEAEAADEALAEEETEAEAAEEAMAEETAGEAEEVEEAAEEEPAEEASEGMECPVCGEPVEPGSANCPVCDTPL
jgi:hypothetical protein